MNLEFRNYRMVEGKELDASLRRKLGVDDDARVEIVDIVGDGSVGYRGYFFDGGSLVVLDREGKQVLAAAQHGVEPKADRQLVEAVAAAYAKARPRIQQTIFFHQPGDDEHPRLGHLTFDADCDCWRADAQGVRFWISGTKKPDPQQLRTAASILEDFARVERAVQGVAPGVTIREIELWKPQTLIVHLDNADKIELPWQPAS